MAWAQENPRFGAASIKPTPPSANELSCMTGIQADAIRFRMACATLSRLIEWGWDLKAGQIQGLPAWGNGFGGQYAVEATASAAVSPAEMRTMMRALLAERFQLKVHVETPLRPVFALTVKDKSKMKEVEPGEGMRGHIRFTMAGRAKVFAGEKARMEEIVLYVASIVQERPIVDATGLTGAYDFRIQWIPDPALEDVDFSLALQDQLGLRLEDRKAPLEVLVIDHAEKPSPDQ